MTDDGKADPRGEPEGAVIVSAALDLGGADRPEGPRPKGSK